MGAVPQVPPSSIVLNYTLPISVYKFQIIEQIKSNNLIIITGSSGIGKTTYVPQVGINLNKI